MSIVVTETGVVSDVVVKQSLERSMGEKTKRPAVKLWESSPDTGRQDGRGRSEVEMRSAQVTTPVTTVAAQVWNQPRCAASRHSRGSATERATRNASAAFGD